MGWVLSLHNLSGTHIRVHPFSLQQSAHMVLYESPGSAFDAVGAGSIPFGDMAMPLGEHLTSTTHDKILRGEYVEVFSLLFHDLKKKRRRTLMRGKRRR